MIKVVVVTRNKEPYIKEIENTLEAIQNEVNGWIEYVPIKGHVNFHIYCNEEGKINGTLPNRKFYDDVIYGTFIICHDDGSGGEDSMTDNEAKIFINMFALNSKEFPCVERR